MEIMPDFAILLAFTLAGSVLILTPGPDMTLFLAKTLGQGRDAGFAAMLGAISGVLVHTGLAAFGLSALLAHSPFGFGLLKIVGALYLLWLAYDAIRHGSSLTLDGSNTRPEAISQVFFKGFAINLLNPKIILFFVTFLPQFISAGDPHASGKLFFLGLYFIALALPSCALMVLGAHAISARLKRSRKLLRITDWLFAGVFAAFAVRLLLAPIRD